MQFRTAIIGFFRRWGILFLSFLIPAGILAAVYTSMRVFPFGHRSILVVDLDGQYIDFYMALRHMVFQGKSPFYSWNLTMGGNMVGIISFYLSSPFSFITLLFPEKYLVESLLVMTLAKVGCAGLAMAFYLHVSWKARGIQTLIFSTSYALMAYMVMYSYNIEFLDGLVFLPLVVLGIEKIVRGGSIAVYCASLALLIIANYYIAYMVCIFAGLYFLYQSGLCFHKGQGKAFFRSLIRFLTASLLSAGLVAFLLAPTFFALASGKLEIMHSLFAIQPKFPLLDILPKLLFASYDTALGTLPNVYCGLVMIVLAMLFFFNSAISPRQKLAAAAFLALLLASFYWSGLDLIWHGLQIPRGFPYRYSFVFGFLVITLAYQAFQEMRHIRAWALAASFAVLLAVLVYIHLHGYAFLPDTMLLVSFLFCCAYFAVLSLSRFRPTLIRPLTALLTVVVLAEAALNTFIYIRKTNLEFHYKDRDSYWSFVDRVQPILEKIRQGDPQFYRVEKTFIRSYNDALTLDYPGISHYSSSINRPSLTFLKQIGFSQPFYRLLYTGQTAPMDAILGVKYLLSETTIQNAYPQIDQAETNDAGIRVYQNPFALPVGFMVNPALSDVHINTYNPLYWQDQIVRAMVDPKANGYFAPLRVEQKALRNVVEQPDAAGWVRYTCENAAVDSTIEFRLRVDSSDPVYAFLAAQDGSKMEVFLNDRSLGYFGENSENNQVLLLGQYPPGASISLKLKLMNRQAVLLKDALVYRLDTPRFTQAYQQLASHALNISQHSDTYLRGSVTVQGEKRLLFTSIPYDPGWAVRVDGREASKVRLLDTFIGVEVPAGSHTIEFSYTPPGLWAGCAISIFSILLAGAALWLRKRKKVVIR